MVCYGWCRPQKCPSAVLYCCLSTFSAELAAGCVQLCQELPLDLGYHGELRILLGEHLRQSGSPALFLLLFHLWQYVQVSRPPRRTRHVASGNGSPVLGWQAAEALPVMAHPGRKGNLSFPRGEQGRGKPRGALSWGPCKKVGLSLVLGEIQRWQGLCSNACAQPTPWNKSFCVENDTACSG